MEMIVGVALMFIVLAVMNWLSSNDSTSDHTAAPDSESNAVYVEALSCYLTYAGHVQWKVLLNMSLGNAERARDLVFLERSKQSNANIEEAIESAIDTWRRDINR